ncbi:MULTISPECIES: minichromosome maintenance protein MCM [Halorussus]|uniref:minichromosome maintenance protein MCM n=1 Tax=Halorussus TaxID=1070314 RepID=UPI000E2141D8|nr:MULTISPECIES: minichromosome maintenance protein MCM [Halorussus]NHN61304.1 minichromosome maintenance protein MCM [Halorussus sp. JP-T4]
MSARSGDLTEKWYEYVYRDETETVRRFVDRYPDERALSVSSERFGHDYRFVRPLLADPDEALRAGKAALSRFLSGEIDRELRDVYLRVSDLPGESEVALADLRAEHLNSLHTMRCVVTDAGPLRPKVVRAAFRCAKCEDVTRHVPQSGREFRTNAKCPRCSSVGYLSFEPEASEYVDAQEVTVRDPDGDDEVPVLLEHDLAGAVSDGDHLRLVGIPRANRTDESAVADTWVESVSMECLTEQNR